MLRKPALEGSPSTSSTTAREYANILAIRLVHSRVHALLCGTVLCAGIVEVIWILHPDGGVGQLPTHGLFVAVESYVTLGLVMELALRGGVQRADFCQRRSNWLDLAVAFISVLSLVLSAVGLETPAEHAFAEMLILGRVTFRLLRLAVVTRGLVRQRRTSDSRKLDIVLDDMHSPNSGSPRSPDAGQSGTLWASAHPL